MNMDPNWLTTALLLLLVLAGLAFVHVLVRGLAKSSSLSGMRWVDPSRPRRIIVALLDQETWRGAVDVACRLAAEHGVAVLLVCVLEVPWTLGLDVPLPEAEEKARAVLEVARGAVAQHGLTAESRIVRHRSATEAIVELARATGAEAIVAESSARSWRPWRRVGRTMGSLLRQAPSQIIVVRAPRQA